MQLAGHYPKMVKAVVASAGHHFGYQMTEQELLDYVEARSSRSQYKFGPKNGPLTFLSGVLKRKMSYTHNGRFQNKESWITLLCLS